MTVASNLLDPFSCDVFYSEWANVREVKKMKKKNSFMIFWEVEWKQELLRKKNFGEISLLQTPCN